ncbi:MAG: response regulator [Lachnospiraceae bacterium]|nr:response regulator [Lachnospiraceae bacterium]
MKKHIFIVDSDIMNLSTVNNSLAHLYKISICNSPDAMFKFLLRLIPDLILLNIDMTKSDKSEVLKNHELYKKIPVILMVPSYISEKQIKYIEKGAAYFVYLPFNNSYLIELIEKYI